MRHVEIHEAALDRLTNIGNSRKLTKAKMKHIMRVAARITRESNREIVTVSDVDRAENWCAEHGWN